MEHPDLSGPGRRSLLERVAPDYLALATANLVREYPHMSFLSMTGPGPVRSHRERHPAFYGSFDWHSCVEMAWVAVRLIRLLPGLPGEMQARRVLGGLLTTENLDGELATFSEPGYLGFERPYGWGWFLTFAAEVDGWDDADGSGWGPRLAPLADLLGWRLETWLPSLPYPQRQGMHTNTAFALIRASAWAERHSPGLQEAIATAAVRLFASDDDYPARYEPSGADFLSGALTEAHLMGMVMGEEFPAWLGRFLPGLERSEPAPLFSPAAVTDTSDGQLAHLAGLNLSRAAGFLWLAERLGEHDARYPPLRAAAGRHAGVSLGHVVGGDYVLEHWLAAFATLLLS